MTLGLCDGCREPLIDASENYCGACEQRWCAERRELRARIATLEEVLREARRSHDQHVCVKGSPMHDAHAPCRCGADEHNARIDTALRRGGS